LSPLLQWYVWVCAAVFLFCLFVCVFFFARVRMGDHGGIMWLVVCVRRLPSCLVVCLLCACCVLVVCLWCVCVCVCVCALGRHRVPTRLRLVRLCLRRWFRCLLHRMNTASRLSNTSWTRLSRCFNGATAIITTTAIVITVIIIPCSSCGSTRLMFACTPPHFPYSFSTFSLRLCAVVVVSCCCWAQERGDTFVTRRRRSSVAMHEQRGANWPAPSHPRPRQQRRR